VHDAKTFAQLDYPVPDVYFSAQYGLAEEAAGAGRWIMLEAHDAQWLLPVHLRTGGSALDAVSPYGYAGIYAATSLSEEDTYSAWHAATHELRRLGCVSIFMRQSPLLERIWHPPGVQWVVRNHPAIQVEVSDIEQAWQNMKGRSRTSIRKAEKLGFTSQVRPAEQSDLVPDSPFRRLYEEGMSRRGASERYFFPDDYYQRLLDGLRGSLFIAEVQSGDVAGEVVASSLLMRHVDQLHYHLSGSAVDAGRNGATNELLWRTMRWASEVGIRTFHLGGGLSGQDSLFKFKASFGGVMKEYGAYGVVIDAEAYDKATAIRAAELGVPVHTLENVGSFPKFRITL